MTEFFLQDIDAISNSIIFLNDSKKNDIYGSFIQFLPSIIVILTFILDRSIASRVRRNELARSWYYKAYFDPTITEIKKTFDLFEEEIKFAHDAFIKLFNKEEIHSEDDRLDFIANIKNDFIDKKRIFEIKIISPIIYNYPQYSQLFEESLLEFEDSVSILFDGDSQENYLSFLENLYKMKSKLLKALSEPAFNKKNSLLYFWKSNK